jgi:hypothetical protein
MSTDGSVVTSSLPFRALHLVRVPSRSGVILSLRVFRTEAAATQALQNRESLPSGQATWMEAQ